MWVMSNFLNISNIKCIKIACIERNAREQESLGRIFY